MRTANPAFGQWGRTPWTLSPSQDAGSLETWSICLGAQMTLATLSTVVSPRRALVDWDYGAHGLWLVLSPEELRAPPPTGGTWGPYVASAESEPRPWSDELSDDLLDDLKRWNDECGEMAVRGDETSLRDEFARARPLAERVQQQLGSEWEVLYTSGGAWHWVALPHGWKQA
jgi:hypothetical protein